MTIELKKDNLDGTEELLQTITVKGIDEIANSEIAIKEGISKPKIVLSFELTRSNLVVLNKAEAKVDEMVFVEDAKPNVKKAKKKGNESA